MKRNYGHIINNMFYYAILYCTYEEPRINQIERKRIERRGEKIERRGERIERRGDRIERRGERIERGES